MIMCVIRERLDVSDLYKYVVVTRILRTCSAFQITVLFGRELVLPTRFIIIPDERIRECINSAAVTQGHLFG